MALVASVEFLMKERREADEFMMFGGSRKVVGESTQFVAMD
tara:strand:+ start:2169 stop:2291 length:123 start_codon:yes stop_codon:yes gene_type:complete